MTTIAVGSTVFVGERLGGIVHLLFLHLVGLLVVGSSGLLFEICFVGAIKLFLLILVIVSVIVLLLLLITLLTVVIIIFLAQTKQACQSYSE